MKKDDKKYIAKNKLQAMPAAFVSIAVWYHEPGAKTDKP